MSITKHWHVDVFRPIPRTIGARSLIIINGADSIGSSHHRCSVPNNKQHRYNRVLAPSVLGP